MRVLITGGAGFIGSHLAEAYVRNGHDVTILDNFSTGDARNVPPGINSITGDIRDLETVQRAATGIELVLHQAAARAVLRSIEDPVETDRSNTLGSLHVLIAARDAGVRRVVLASSSSIYGGLAPTPTPESALPQPRSPYAVSKLAAESYARVFAELYELETVSLRYFNVYGPRQRPESQYAAVIPLFIRAISSGSQPIIHGDGTQSRDFTFIDDVVKANELASAAAATTVSGNAYNIARGEEHSLLELVTHLNTIFGARTSPKYVEPRAGDVRTSKADTTAAALDLAFNSAIGFREGLARTVEWFKATISDEF